MTNPFKLTNIDERKKEFAAYRGKEIGLDSSKGMIYGIIKDEDEKNLYLNPHLVYNPIPLGKNMISNAEKRNSTRVVPKTLLTKLVQEYYPGYLDEFVGATNQKDEYTKVKFAEETHVPFNYREVPERNFSFKEKISVIYKILANKIKV